MTNITALLLVLTLAGPPVASVLCVTQCQQPAATWGHCHGDMAASEGPMVSAASDCGDPAVSESPYLVEHRELLGPAVLTSTSPLTAPAPVRTDAPAVFARASGAWLKPTLVLRL